MQRRDAKRFHTKLLLIIIELRYNDQYRIAFAWVEGSAENVEIVDYH